MEVSTSELLILLPSQLKNINRNSDGSLSHAKVDILKQLYESHLEEPLSFHQL